MVEIQSAQDDLLLAKILKEPNSFLEMVRQDLEKMASWKALKESKRKQIDKE